MSKKEKQKKLETQILTRKEWYDALRCPPPYRSKRTYNRKGYKVGDDMNGFSH